MTKQREILLTNDDGIQSPGLWAAARVLSQLGYVHVVAPRDQFSGAGRSLPSNSDGIITTPQVLVNGKQWTVYSVGGTPAQAVLHAIYEILPTAPDLVVSGINYGENLGVGVTVSGTVGAALEAAGCGIPALAVSLETDVAHHLSYSVDVDFTAAAHFTALFGQFLLEKKMPYDVDVLKVDVPCDATTHTPWEVTRLSRNGYFEPVAPQRTDWKQPETVGYRRRDDACDTEPGTDVHSMCVCRSVSVTPLSLDLTSRVELAEFERLLRLK
ncbi:MAG: 5'/3'-nucleotidase SurE [Anaerolineales bacterium]|nr:5'/3'-nucleotidase SurE [Anaerolineales bacterium]